MVRSGLTGVGEHVVAKAQQAQHEDEGRVDQHRRTADIGGCDNLVDIVGELVPGDEVRFQYRMEEDASSTAGGRQRQGPYTKVPEVFPGRAKRCVL